MDREDKMEPTQARGKTKGRDVEGPNVCVGGGSTLEPAQKQQKLETPARARPLLDEAGGRKRHTEGLDVAGLG